MTPFEHWEATDAVLGRTYWTTSLRPQTRPSKLQFVPGRRERGRWSGLECLWLLYTRTVSKLTAREMKCRFIN